VVLPDDSPEVLRLASLAQQLGDENKERREAAREAFLALGPDDLPAIRGRIARIRRGRPPHNWAVDIMNRLRRHGSTEETGRYDLVEGAMTELGNPHPRSREHQRVIAMAEPAMLWHALDRMESLEAQRAVFGLIGLDEGLWMPEARNWLRRRRAALTAAAIHARRDGDRFVRSWGRFAYEELGAEDPGQVIPSLEREQLPDVLEAYAEARMQSAMRVIVSYVGSERRAIRRSARNAIELYGGNAIWILRTAFRNETGAHPPREWGWRQVTTQLYERVDSRRMEPVRAALEAGIAAHEAGDLDAMQASFDEVLARMPELERPEPVAAGYVALARRAREAGELDAAEQHYRRALRLAGPDHAEWRAELGFLRAQRASSHGVWDEAAFQRVTAVIPDHAQALSSLAAMRTPAVVTRREASTGRSKWGLAAAGLLALLGIGLLWRSAPESVPEPSESAESETFDDDVVDAFEVTLDQELEEAAFNDAFDIAFDPADATLPDPV